jgi:hypothetical protein
VAQVVRRGTLNPPAKGEPDLSALLRNAANVVVPVDGVILGLVYTFATAKKSSVPSVVKVGAISLVVGVIIGLLLYALVAGKITTPVAQVFSTLLFSLIAWALWFADHSASCLPSCFHSEGDPVVNVADP